MYLTRALLTQYCSCIPYSNQVADVLFGSFNKTIWWYRDAYGWDHNYCCSMPTSLLFASHAFYSLLFSLFLMHLPIFFPFIFFHWKLNQRKEKKRWVISLINWNFEDWLQCFWRREFGCVFELRENVLSGGRKGQGFGAFA